MYWSDVLIGVSVAGTVVLSRSMNLVVMRYVVFGVVNSSELTVVVSMYCPDVLIGVSVVGTVVLSRSMDVVVVTYVVFGVVNSSELTVVLLMSNVVLSMSNTDVLIAVSVDGTVVL